MAEIFDFSATDASNTGRWPENMNPNDINDAGRADEGILARWYQDMDGSRSASGSSNAFAVTSSRTIGALFNNLRIAFTANHSITGASTLNLNGLGAKDIKRLNGMSLVEGDIVSGQFVEVIYKSADDDWYMTSAPSALGTPIVTVEETTLPTTPSSGNGVYWADANGQAHFLNDGGMDRILTLPLLHVRDEKAANMAGGDFNSGAWRTRVLNTEKTNQITGASLSSDTITLPAGTYRVVARAPARNVGRHQAKLRNTADSTDAVIGSGAATSSDAQTDSHVVGSFTIAAEKTFQLQHQCSSTVATSGFGVAANFGVVEVYSEVMIWKVA